MHYLYVMVLRDRRFFLTAFEQLFSNSQVVMHIRAIIAHSSSYFTSGCFWRVDLLIPTDSYLPHNIYIRISTCYVFCWHGGTKRLSNKVWNRPVSPSKKKNRAAKSLSKKNNKSSIIKECVQPVKYKLSKINVFLTCKLRNKRPKSESMSTS